MKNVIERLREEQQVHLDKAQTIGKAVAILMDDDVLAFLPTTEEIDPISDHLSPNTRVPSSLEKGSLRDLVLDIIEEDGPIECNDIAELLMVKFPLQYEPRSYQSVRGSVSGTMTYLRTKKPKVRNLKWAKDGKAYAYWFEGKR